MEMITENHLKITKAWIEIMAKFLTNQKALKYMIDSKFDLVQIFLKFLWKARETLQDESSSNKLLKQNINLGPNFKFIVKHINLNIYKCLESILGFDNANIERILEHEENFKLIFVRIRKVKFLHFKNIKDLENHKFRRILQFHENIIPFNEIL